MSPNGKYNLEMERSSERLALYVNAHLIWQLRKVSRFVLEEDGSLVFYNSNNDRVTLAITKNGDHFQLMNNGNMVVLDAENNQVWTSFTYRGRINFNFIS